MGEATTAGYFNGRVRTDGAEFWLDGKRQSFVGVTYGSFRARSDGFCFPETKQIKADFAAMAKIGLNLVRIYQLPPEDLLQAARDNQLRIIVGVDYFDWRMANGLSSARRRRQIRDGGYAAIDGTMIVCNSRPEIMAISVGNEIPADVVRVHGRLTVERDLARFIKRVHEHDSEMLVTYTNFPSTEYLDPVGQDFVSFNVFLEEKERFENYIARLKVLADNRPLMISEFGLPALLSGDEAQASLASNQIQAMVNNGVAATTWFSWTDDWVVNNVPVTGWGFGVTNEVRDKRPSAMRLCEFHSRNGGGVLTEAESPRVTVVICAFNEEKFIANCVKSVLASSHPNFEVIVCDDGSTDSTREIVCKFPVRLLELDHAGLSNARNAGAVAATGEYVVYLDADTEVPPNWLGNLVSMFDSSNVSAVGGPNLPFSSVEISESVIAHAPGNPREVLISDNRAEHVAGCNMAIRRDVLLELGGFDAQYICAGDDVDLCWRLLDQGGEIGFAPGAHIRHHRRNSIRRFLRQQMGYGRAERMLSGPHAHRFNLLGQARWSGIVYGGVGLPKWLSPPVIYHGYAGTGLFQTVSQRRELTFFSSLIALLPALVTGGILTSGVALLTWSAPLAVTMLLVLTVIPLLIVFSTAALRTTPPPICARPNWFCVSVGMLYVLSPLARAWGRVCGKPLGSVYERPTWGWSGNRLEWLRNVCSTLTESGWKSQVGGPNDSYDIKARSTLLLAEIKLAVVWEWDPQYSLTVRPSLLAVAFVITLVATGLVVGSFNFAFGGVLSLLAIALFGWSTEKKITAMIEEPIHRQTRVATHPNEQLVCSGDTPDTSSPTKKHREIYKTAVQGVKAQRPEGIDRMRQLPDYSTPANAVSESVSRRSLPVTGTIAATAKHSSRRTKVDG